MKRISKEAKIVLVFLFVFSIIFVISLFFTDSEKKDENKTAINIYFLNSAKNNLEKEVHYIEKSSNAEMAQSVLEALYAGPKNTDMVSVAPGEIIVLDAKIVSGTLFEIEFSDNYYDLDPLEELFFRSSLVWTMTELEFINDVHIYIDGYELLNDSGKIIGQLNRSNVVINSKLPPEKVDAQWVKLYFKVENGDWLAVENRYIEAADHSLEYEIVSEIIKGPNGTTVSPTISPNVTLKEVTLDRDICYVSLNSDFLPKQADKIVDFKFSVYSIVNSLTENSKIKGVQFLIDSEQITEAYDGLDLANPFNRNEFIILE